MSGTDADSRHATATRRPSRLYTVPPSRHAAPPPDAASRPAGPGVAGTVLRLLDQIHRERGGMVLSLDVFDTLLYRRVPRPTDAFVLLGERLHRAGAIASGLAAPLFAEVRRHCEQQARRRKQAQGTTEVTLQEIYAELPSDLVRVGHEALIEHELSVEQELARLDHDLADVCARASARGIPVVLVSDTYLSSSQLRRLLASAGLDPGMLTDVVVSCEQGVSKAQGLLSIVATRLSGPTRGYLHIGDSDEADLAPGRLLEIECLRYPKLSQSASEFVQREERMAGFFAEGSRASRYDHGLTGLRARVLTNLQLSGSGSASKSPMWRTGALTYGPVVTGFLEWLAREWDPSRGPLCFMTREGLSLVPLMREFLRRTGREGACLALLTSRAVIFRASIIEGSEQEFRELLTARKTPMTPRSFAAIWGLGPDDLSICWEMADAPLRPGTPLSEQFLERLLSQPSILGQIRDASASARERLYRYIRRELSTVGGDPAELDTLTISDLGWSGHSQQLLSRSLEIEWPRLKVRGLYLALDDRAMPRLAGGLDLRGWLFHCGDAGGYARLALACKEITEQVTMPPGVGSVLDFEDDGTPIHEPPPEVGVSQRLAQAQLRRGLEGFFREYLRLRQRDVLAEDLLANAVDHLRFVYGRPMILPTPEELEIFGGWAHDENNMSPAWSRIADDVVEHIAEYACFRQLLTLPTYWPVGLLLRRRNTMVDHFLKSYASDPYARGLHDVLADDATPIGCRFQVGGPNAPEHAVEKVEGELFVGSDGRGFCGVNLYADSSTSVVWRLADRAPRVRVDKVVVSAMGTRTQQRGTAVFPRRGPAPPPIRLGDRSIGRLEQYEDDLVALVFDDVGVACPVEISVYLCVRIG